MYTVNVTSKQPTTELMDPKNGKATAKNQMGRMTGIRHDARSNMFLAWCTPRIFSHTKYRGVTANPTVMNCSKKENPARNTNHTLFVKETPNRE